MCKFSFQTSNFGLEILVLRLKPGEVVEKCK